MSAYIRESSQPVSDVVATLQRAISDHGFGLLHEYDFRATLEGKGFSLDRDCHVLEVCNPKQAFEILTRDMGVAMALPCRISVYEDQGKTRVGMVLPTAMLKLVSENADLLSAAEAVEQTLKSIIDDAV